MKLGIGIVAMLACCGGAGLILTAVGQVVSSQQHQRKVEAGLLPAVVITGVPSSGVLLSEEMARLHVPGVSIAVIHSGKVDWCAGYGVTRIGGSPVNPDTLFQAGSVSKPITAFGIVRLAEQGLIPLDEDVNRLLKSWKLPSNSLTADRAVTPRDLLSHTAGTTVHGFDGYESGVRVPSLVQVLDGLPPANSEPVRVTQPVGESYRYSGGGYTILQQIAMDVTHSLFAPLFTSLVFRPLGMFHSNFEQPLDPVRRSHAAMPYDSSGVAIRGGPHTYPELAAAGLWTTAPDLARFVLEVQRSWNGGHGAVLSRPISEEMLSPVKSDWSLGFEIGGSPANRYFYHDGANEGYKATLVGYEHEGDGAIILTNGDQGYQLGLEIVRSIATEYGWPDFHPIQRTKVAIDTATQDRYIGQYTIKDLGTFEVRRQGTNLVAEIRAGVIDPLVASSDHSFFVTSQDLQLTFSTDADGGEIQAGTFHADFRRVSK